MNTTTKLDGITYQVERFDGLNLYSLTKIGKRGNPTAQHRPGSLRSDGTWKLGAWA